MPLTRKPIQRDIAAVRQYARLSKNFVVNGDLARVVKQEQLTGRDLYVLIALLAEAQKQDKRKIYFSSLYSILKLLGWSDRASDYDDLDRALDAWMTVEIAIPKFYVPAESVDPEFDYLVRQRAGGGQKGVYDSVTFKRILDIRRTGDRIGVTFSKDFWNANSKEDGYFVKAWPDIVKQLRYPPEIFLWLLLSAFHGKLRRDLETLPWKIGLWPRSRPWIKNRIQQALDRINKAADRDYRMKITTRGIVRIAPTNLAGDVRNKLYEEGDLWHIHGSDPDD